MKNKLTGFKTYRHEDNPKEKEFHDKFVSTFLPDRENIFLEQIVLLTDTRGETNERLTDREKQLIITAMQWLGSPVGQGFLENCGFTQIENNTK